MTQKMRSWFSLFVAVIMLTGQCISGIAFADDEEIILDTENAVQTENFEETAEEVNDQEIEADEAIADTENESAPEAAETVVDEEIAEEETEDLLTAAPALEETTIEVSEEIASVDEIAADEATDAEDASEASAIEADEKVVVSETYSMQETVGKQALMTANVPVASITLSGKTNIKVGESDYPVATVLPETATNKTVTWSSMNTSVASVSSSGVVYGLAEGTTLISAHASDGSGVYGYYELTVSPAHTDPDKVTSVTLVGIATLDVGKTYAVAYSILPTTATDIGLTWESSDTSIATVSDLGVVTAVAPGECVITATSKNNPEAVGSFTLKVADYVMPQKVNIYLSGTIAIGGTYYPAYEVLPANASNLKVTWTSSNPTVATVDATYGTIKVLQSGKTVIRATSVADEKVYGEYLISITGVPVTWIALAYKSHLLIGETDAVITAVFPDSATNKDIIWTTSNPNVATVSSNGVVKGVQVGTAVITATAADGSGVKNSYTVNVVKTKKNVTSVTVSGLNVMGVGTTTQLTAKILPADAYNRVLWWASDDPSVATVDQTGTVTAVAPGKAIISGIATDGSLVRGMHTITVKPSVKPVTTVVASGKTTLYPSEVDYAAYGILPADASDLTVSWSSSNTAVATVDQYGIVKAVGAGTCDIIATSNDGGNVSGKYTVTVKSSVNQVTKVAVHGKPMLAVGDVDYVAYEIWPTNADIKTVTWTSSNPAVASVNATNGTVIGLKNGTTTITATATDGSKVSASYVLTVGSVSNLVTRVEIYGSGTVNYNAKEYLAYAVWPVNATNKTVTWKSSNPAVATVTADTGIVTGVSAGTAVITATANDGSKISATYTVTVNVPGTKVTNIAIHGSGTVKRDHLEYLAYEVWPTSATVKEVTWTSSNPGVATVDAYTGVVKGIAVGTAVITATAKDGSGVTATYTVTVTN